jgi:hypothetical protein
MSGKGINELIKDKEKEELQRDSKNTKKYSSIYCKAMEYIREVAIRNYEDWRLEFIQENMDMSVDEMMAVNRFVEFLEDKA